ncbi:nicotinamide mononucleotide transporter [Viridibacillus sp. YIM B01967]|uniref:Nicotinamide mononucleotide transporter n=1 Tax=Viridibacillus soli TaxID=2798301 RepID=A0ABS1H8E8_9BACL|nr:nicotinamide riboside transporter PnuC [Viridibacillus soli]MBK3495692.1 nicotinamide mononucleotide transporter [Viridibacillus soli]
MKDWTLFEKLWLTSFTLINIYLFFAWDDTLLGLISSITGMLCVVLVAKGKMSNYYFGMIQTSTYAYISYTYGLYGEAMLNGLFYFPIQFIGLYMWNKHKVKDDVIGEDVEVKRLTKKGWITVITISIVASLIYAELLSLINAQQVRIDSMAVVLSIIAQFLMIKRYAEQWIMWIVVNALSVVLWVVTLTQSGGNDWSMLVMWIAFLFNSVFGYYNWIKMSKGQQLSEVK